MAEPTPENLVEDQPKGYSSKLTALIESRNVDALLDLVDKIDTVITGKIISKESVRQQRDILEKFITDLSSGAMLTDAIIYLGDGGFSRLILSFYDKELKIFLSPVSTDRVKANWDRVK